MAEKLIFSMQVFTLGFSVVMLVLLLLYLLIALTNRLYSRPPEIAPPEVPLMPDQDHLPPRLVAAVLAAVNHHRATLPGDKGPVKLRVSLAERKGSRWAAAGRSALIENSGALERLRRK